jgi:hypothetical protein
MVDKTVADAINALASAHNLGIMSASNDIR